jgi:hypothetical protein
MITEDLTVFLSDFGVSVTAGAVSGLGIFDMPGEAVLNGMAISMAYTLTCLTSEFGSLGYGASITVDGDAYLVQEAAKISDGTFIQLTLERVSGAPPWVPGATDIEIELDGDLE